MPSSTCAVTPATTPGRFVGDDCEQLVDRNAAVRAPQIGKRLAFELAIEQRADARTGEAEPQLADEIGRQHEGVAERVADFGRIDVGARRRHPAAAFLGPVVEHGPCGLMFHGRHLFRRETAPRFGVPGWDIRAGFSPRRHRWSRRRAAGRGRGGAPRVSVKIAIALPRRKALLGSPSNHPHGFQEGASPPFLLSAALAAGRSGGVTHVFRPAPGPL